LENNLTKGDSVDLKFLSVGKFNPNILNNHFVKWRGIIKLNYQFTGEKKDKSKIEELENYIVINGSHAEYGDDFFFSFTKEENKILKTLEIFQCKNKSDEIAPGTEKEEIIKVFGGKKKNQKIIEKDENINNISNLFFVKPNCVPKKVTFEKHVEYITGENFLPLPLFLTMKEILDEKILEIQTPTPTSNNIIRENIFTKKIFKQTNITNFFKKK
jgi:hypothetical protein